jgi:hypothetical protein
MSTLITAAILLAVVLWAMAAYGRLIRLRRVVRIRWREVAAQRQRYQEVASPAAAGERPATDRDEAIDELEQARLRYNLVAVKYNAAIVSFPGNLVAGLAGFKAAELLTQAEADGTVPPGSQ